MIRTPLLSAACLALLAVSAGCAKAPPPARDTAADVAKLKADALGWFDDCAKGDVDGMANRYAEDALVMPPGAPAVSGRPAIRALLAAQLDGLKAGGLSLKNVSVTGAGVDGDTGWITGTYAVVDANGTAVDSGNYLSIHRRAGEAWPYIRDTWNSDRAPVPAPAPASAPASAPATRK